jgi:UDP-N-acetylglucosamine 2-epimerase (non-hydrolysing)
VGNVMIDTLLQHREKADASTILSDLGLEERGYAVLTLHRPSNVDNQGLLEDLIGVLEEIQSDLPVIFPAHPRTRSRFQEFGLAPRLEAMSNLRLLEPVGYLDFLKLTASAKIVLTDSGGIQEETTILKVPCLTLRENTERPVTLEIGSNQLVGTDPQKILTAYRGVRDSGSEEFSIPPLWDGHAAERIVKILEAQI